MFNMRIRSEYGVHIHRKKTIHRAAVLAAVLLLAAVGLLYTAGRRSRSGNERKELLEYWNAGAFDQAFSVSGAALASRPLDYFLLTLHGFSAYQLGIAQINSSDTLGFIDECVRTLRKAMLLKSGRNDGRVFYVLGKAYCYKGPSYADLAVLYLEKARAAPYQAGDIPEYLGLAYANLRDYRSSVAAFSQALEPAYPAGDGGPELSGEANPSDVLLLSIARSYTALEETESAQAYLLRCIEVSRDVNTRVAARLLLGEILGKGGNPGEAEVQYTAVLEEAGENAEARYQLGVLYAAAGDETRARAEWRRAVRSDSTHAKARARLENVRNGL
jgi:tetratricopeptide (TPR) repeat protein